jgi:hypothetical protein
MTVLDWVIVIACIAGAIFLAGMAIGIGIKQSNPTAEQPVSLPADGDADVLARLQSGWWC